MRFKSALNVIVLLAASVAGSLYAQDSEPYTKTKVCNPAETRCADVDASLRLFSDSKITGDSTNTKIGNVTDALKVNVTNSFAAGTPDRTTFTYGTTIQNEIGGVFQDTSPGVTAGQGAAVRITQFRALHLNLRDSSGNESGVSGNPVRTDPTGTTPQPSSQSGTWTTGRTWTLSSGSDSIAAVQSGAWTTGRTWVLASGTDSIAAVQSGTWTVQQGSPPWSVVGNVASGATDSGNPLKTGGIFNTTQPTVTNGQRVDSQSTARGAEIVATGIDPFDIRNVTGTVSLPTGASTAANQTTINTSINSVIGTKAAGTAATNSELTGCVYNSGGVTLTNGQQVGTQCTSTGSIKVDAAFTTPQRTMPSYNGDKMRYVDMNASSGGVARGTGIASTSTYTVIFNYSGSGELFSFLVGFEGNLIGSDDFIVKLEIDGVINFEVDTNDIGTGNLYNLNTVQDEIGMGFSLTSNVLRFNAPKSGGLHYNTSVKVSIKKGTTTTSKQFRAGAVYLTKET